jgi:hypothetical protein
MLPTAVISSAINAAAPPSMAAGAPTFLVSSLKDCFLNEGGP